jgi:malate dehydrogenase (quinone)
VKNIKDIIHKVKHVSVVQENDIEFLKKRYETMKNHHFFDKMIFSKKLKEISKWIPLITKEWGENNPIAATIVPSGTDVNY